MGGGGLVVLVFVRWLVGVAYCLLFGVCCYCLVGFLAFLMFFNCSGRGKGWRPAFFISHFWRVFGGFGLDFLKIPIFSGFLGFFYRLNYISLRGRR